MSLFGGILKPGDAAALAVQRELTHRRDRWEPRPGGYLYRGGGDYMLRHGRAYRGQVLPNAYEPMAQAACFWNAMQMARDNPDLRYVEGLYTTSSNRPTPHAWVIDPDDRVIEVTHVTTNLERYHDTKGMPIMPPEHWSYFGVIFRWELVQWHEDTVGEMCMFDRPPGEQAENARLDVSQDHDWPILKYPYDPDRIALW